MPPPARENARAAAPTSRHSVRRRLVVALGIGSVALAVAVLAGAGIGPVSIPPARVWETILHGLGVPGHDITAAEQAVVGNIRLPRVIIGALVGAALAASGVAMQGTFRNALAEPGIVGVSAGGAVGAVAAIYFGATAAGAWALPACAFVGSCLALVFVVLVSRAAVGGSSATTMLLVGIGANALLGAVISVMVATAGTEEDLRSIMFWLQGGLDARTWSHVRLVTAPLLLALALLCLAGRHLNVMSLGDEQGQASGLDVRRARLAILTVAALATASAVAVSGTIAFVGLAVPHVLRLALGPDHRVLLPASMLFGAAFLVVADLAARMLFSPITLQVGVVTSLVGAPILLASILRGRAVGR